MLIVDERVGTQKEFKELKYGEVFLWEGLYSIKMYTGMEWNAVDLEEGSVWHIEDSRLVSPINCELHILD